MPTPPGFCHGHPTLLILFLFGNSVPSPPHSQKGLFPNIWGTELTHPPRLPGPPPHTAGQLSSSWPRLRSPLRPCCRLPACPQRCFHRHLLKAAPGGLQFCRLSGGCHKLLSSREGGPTSLRRSWGRGPGLGVCLSLMREGTRPLEAQEEELTWGGFQI